jgi:Cu/Ag efflux protein CusF
MVQKLEKTLVLVLAVLLVTSTMALAATKKAAKSTTVSGTVEAVDVTNAMITVKTDDGKSLNYKVGNKKLLNGVKTGDQVMIQVAGKSVKTLTKQ